MQIPARVEQPKGVVVLTARHGLTESRNEKARMIKSDAALRGLLIILEPSHVHHSFIVPLLAQLPEKMPR